MKQSSAALLLHAYVTRLWAGLNRVQSQTQRRGVRKFRSHKQKATFGVTLAVMESAGRCPSTSSVSSVSMLEVKAETRLVLQAFLHRTAAVPLKDRPGRVGGAYRDHTKYSSKPQPKAKENCDSQAEEVSSADEKSKTGFMGFIKQLPQWSATQRTKDTNRNSQSKLSRNLTEDDVISPSSTSDEEESEKKQQKKLSRKKIKRRISKFFKKKLEKENEKEHAPVHPRPNTLPINNGPEIPPTIISPSHPPKFYDEVAEKLEQIAYRSTSIKTPTSESTQGPPIQTLNEAPVLVSIIEQIHCID